MKVLGVERMSQERLNFEIQHGARFVIFEYCVSVFVLSFKRPSPIYFLKGEESALGRRLAFSLISLLFGWWGIPWGPIWTIGSVFTNLRGGRDVTSQVMSALPVRPA
ncbi:MAG TPA: hypothetical protein VJ144_02860 [Candidatus Polarisedimenticolia bacterium]|nr:hypothetical protein [Candidatus Polarisedimenticolia bacterium]